MHADLDLRLQARALVLAIEPRLTPGQAAESLVAMAGATPAAPIAARRALARLVTANSYRPSERTRRAIAALGLALTCVQQRRSSPLGRPTDKDGPFPDTQGATTDDPHPVAPR